MTLPIAITAATLLTPLDDVRTSTWEALRAGRRIGGRTRIADGLVREEAALDRSLQLALAAAERLPLPPADVHLFCGSSKGPILTLLAAAENVRAGRPLTGMQARHVVLGVGAMGAVLRERLRIMGPAHTSVAACSSGLHALHRAALAIRRGECERAMVVAADASLHPLFEGSFERLGVLTPIEENGLRRCEPFGEAGEGFFLIEAAAAVMIEATPRGGEPLAWLEETWIGGDGTGLIAIDEATRGLRTGLRAVVGDNVRDLAFVHAHATGTAHDRHELAAIRNVYGNEVSVFSHKRWLGHSLGAAGLVSVALSVMSHQHGETPDGVVVPAGCRSVTIAQGFGGHVGVVALRGVAGLGDVAFTSPGRGW